MLKAKIGEKGKVVIKWNVLPIDRTPDKEKEIISKFSKKYQIPRENIKVEPIFVHKDKSGQLKPLCDNVVANINDPKFQQELFKRYLEINEIKDYDFSKILEIDSLINSHIEYESYENHKKYALKWIKWSNFMSYGKDNYFDFTKLHGMVLLTSEPANQGGKTTFCLDLFRFLLFGKVTSREDGWTLSKVFNKHLPNETEVSVEGCVEIDGVEYIIRRIVTRPKLEKRTSKSKVQQKITYYKVVNGEYINLEDGENLGEGNGNDTNKAIKEAIGNESDFDLMICVTSGNLQDLISLKDTERGRLVSRWIGLLPLEEKDKVARDIYNKSIVPNLYTSKYNKDELSKKVKQLESVNDVSNEAIDKISKEQKQIENDINESKATRDTLMRSKAQIDETLTKVDVTTLNEKLIRIKKDGEEKRALSRKYKEQLTLIGDIKFNEQDYIKVDKECTKMNIDLATKRERLKSIKKDITSLEKSEYCPTCGAKLKNVDNSKLINEKKQEMSCLITEGKNLAKSLKEKESEKGKLSIVRGQYNEKVKLQLTLDKVAVDIDNLLSQYKETSRILKEIERNKQTIEQNNKIELSIRNIDIKIKNLETSYSKVQSQINEERNNIAFNNKVIEDTNKIIEMLNKEVSTIRNWKLYLDMIGKHGISKLVVRNALPIINGELERLLNGICDFTVEVSIDDRNDVAFYLIHDGVKSSLGSGSGFEQTVSSIALRCVLSKISTFSKPSFVVFDEILGGVADENYDQIKSLYDKIVKDYSVILQISHLKQIYDWHDTIITVKKENNISRIVRS